MTISAAEDFTVAVDDAVLDDLHRRLRQTRWPTYPRSAPWQYGTEPDYARRLIDYWIDGYDWRAQEAAINRFDNKRVTIDGLQIHYMIERGSGPEPRPLLITHGWPGSIVELMGVIERLAHPERFGGDIADAFTVVVPSLPGFGFSQAPDAPMTLRDVGGMLHRLMTGHLGFARFFMQGGDMGSILSSWVAYDYPDAIIAVHLNNIAFLALPDEDARSEEEKAWVKANTAWRKEQDGYRTQQGTRPQTLAYGLTDSPAGLATWIVEKFHDWTIPGEAGDPPFGMDEMLTNIMLYWLAGPAAASWYYLWFMNDPAALRLPDGDRITVPVGVLLSPNDTATPPPNSVIERTYTMVRRTDAATGGHFAALEQPELLVDEVRTFFRGRR